jgi:hypothetical protein
MWEAFKEEWVHVIGEHSFPKSSNGVRREDGTTLVQVSMTFTGWRTFVMKTPEGGGGFLLSAGMTLEKPHETTMLCVSVLILLCGKKIGE